MTNLLPGGINIQIYEDRGLGLHVSRDVQRKPDVGAISRDVGAK
jgi:hypothetical protein